MSSSQRDSPKRIAHHRNVVEAANAAGVRRIWYVSLAFGGYHNTSQINFQQAHYATELMLKEYVTHNYSRFYSSHTDSPTSGPVWSSSLCVLAYMRTLSLYS